ncbi:MAG: hypothetical protein AAF434_12590 [Pseudomonadota bacterium]
MSTRDKKNTKCPVINICVLALIGLFSPNSFAIECDSVAFYGNPLIGNPVDISKETISKSESIRLEKLFRKMRGTWTGKGVKVECKGEKENQKVFKNHADMKSSIEFSDEGRLRLENRIKSKKDNIERNEMLEYFLSESNFRAYFNNNESNVLHLKSDRNSTLFVIREDNPSVSGGRWVRDAHTTFSISGSTLLINFKLYINGLLRSEIKWKLKKR